MRVSESTISIASYPFEQFLVPRTDPAHNIQFSALDREAFEQSASAQSRVDKTFREIVLENEYVRLTFLPELGGRLYQVTYKPTNQSLFYNNRVLKPSPWGPAGQGGWLAVGGMEWALPVNEHGYEWGQPWQAAVEQTAEGATVTLIDSRATDRVRARIRVTLPRSGAYVIVNPRIENPTVSVQRVQFWVNAMLAPGGARNISPGTRFYFPTDAVLVHSTGNPLIPAANVPASDASAPRAPLSFHNAGGRDLALYANWQDYLGVFAADLGASDLASTFVGAYNEESGLGIARVFSPREAPGVKLFGFGSAFCCRSAFADDDSDYFEIWGGLPRTFFADDDVALAAGQTREWTDYWLPVPQTGGIGAATRAAVLNVQEGNHAAQVSVFSPVPRTAILILEQGEQELWRRQLALAPDRTFTETIPIGEGALRLRLIDQTGTELARTP